MFKSIVSKITGDPAQRTMSKYQSLVDEVNALEPEYQQMSDDDLRAVTAEFREELQQAVDELLHYPPAVVAKAKAAMKH